MTIDDIVRKFVDNPTRMRPGATSLSKRYKCSVEDIYAARMRARAILKAKAEVAEAYKTVRAEVIEYRGFFNKLFNWLMRKGWK